MTPDLNAMLHEALLRFPFDTDSRDLVPHIEKLLDLGADLTACDDDGLRPLERVLSWDYSALRPAAKQDAHRVLSLLLRRGAPIENRGTIKIYGLAYAWDDDKQAAKKLACEQYRRSDPELSRQLEEISIYWPQPGSEETPLLKRSFISACIHAELDKITYFLHVFPNCRDWSDDSQLDYQANGIMAASRGGSRLALDALVLLLVAGHDINWQNDEGNTALHYVCSAEYRDPEMVYALAELGADPELRNNNLKTARHMARVSHPSNDAEYGVCEDVIDAALALREERGENGPKKSTAPEQESWQSRAVAPGVTLAPMPVGHGKGKL